jgi:hypothetical protein
MATVALSAPLARATPQATLFRRAKPSHREAALRDLNGLG